MAPVNQSAQSTSDIDLSIVIPAWNEVTRLPLTLEKIERFQHKFKGHLEVVIADDGSCDGTTETLERFQQRINLQILRSPVRRGPGHAVRRGVLAARGDRILISDADGPVPFEDTMLLWAALDKGVHFAAGSRVKDPAKLLKSQPSHRVLMGKVWRSITGRIVPTGIHDTQCGFKLMKRDCARSVFQAVHSNGFGFHVEALYRARRQNFSIQEIPVRWKDISGSKVNLVRDPVIMLGEIFRIAARAKASNLGLKN